MLKQSMVAVSLLKGAGTVPAFQSLHQTSDGPLASWTPYTELSAQTRDAVD